jgi:hypothetical protein
MIAIISACPHAPAICSRIICQRTDRGIEGNVQAHAGADARLVSAEVQVV